MKEEISEVFDSKNDEEAQRQLELQRQRTEAEQIQKVVVKRKKTLDQLEKQNVQEKKRRLKDMGRLMSDSALTTYFGKPAWHAYGNGNTHPPHGGLIYGDYMKTHNVNPHSMPN